MRINKYLAQLGIASRRKADEMIVAGKVTINDKRANLGDEVNAHDEVRVDGKQIADGRSQITEKFVYIMLNKPRGVVTTVKDEKDRKTVMDLVNKFEARNSKSETNSKSKTQKIQNTRLFPVGRLDIDSEGLVLLTNDGEWAYKLTHPKFGVTKEYEVEVDGKITDRALEKLRTGVRVAGRMTRPATVEVINAPSVPLFGKEGEGEVGVRKLKFVIKEGRNRQVRRMCKAVNLEVVRLKRVAIGEIRLGNLRIGEWRELGSRS